MTSLRKSIQIVLLSVVFGGLSFAGSSLARAARSSMSYKVVKTIKLGGDSGWDYLLVDPEAHRLYISRSTHVMVVNSDTGEVVGDIPGTNGVHGIALVRELGKGFTSNGRDNSVTVFDLQTLKPSKQIPVGKNPDAIIYDPAAKLIFTGNGASRDATAIDPKSETVKGTVALDGRPEFAVSDEKGHVFINLEDKSMIAEIDSRKLAVLARWPIAPAEEPSGLAIDRQHHRLFSVGSNKLMAVVDSETGKVVTTVPIGSGVDAAGFDPSTGLVFSSNGDGTLTVIHEDSADKFSVVQTLPTQRGARTMTLDLKTHNVFLITAEFGPPPTPTAEHPHPRPSIVPGSFTLLIVGK